MLPASGKGHTLVEVWDDRLGWTVVDPSNDGYLTGTVRHSAAADLLSNPGALEWRSFGPAPASAGPSLAYSTR